jgi:hypothetical protein
MSMADLLTASRSCQLTEADMIIVDLPVTSIYKNLKRCQGHKQKTLPPILIHLHLRKFTAIIVASSESPEDIDTHQSRHCTI